MKLKQIRLKNFAKFEKFEMVFNDDITNLIGMNGDGKTTVGLTALWAGFKGIAEKSTTGHLIGQRFRFITEGKKSLDVEITLHDEEKDMDIVLTRHITKSTNTIKIESSSLYPELTKEYMENLFNVAFLSASHFSALTGKEQAAAMGIDTTSFDTDMKSKKEDAKGYRRDIAKIGELVPVAICEKKNIDVLQAQFEAATEHNATITTQTAQLSTARDAVEDATEEVQHAIDDFNAIQEKHEKDLELLEVAKVDACNVVNDFPAIEEPIPLKPINKAIADIVESNEKYFKYETYKTNVAELEEFQGYLDKNLELQKDISEERAKYLQSKSFGIKGLQIDEAGNLTKDGKLIRQPYFSKGELEVLVARIAMNLNPELKVRFIDDFEMLDDINQEKLLKNLMKKGFQIITATVGNKKKDDKSVLLRACKIADGAEPEEVDADEWDDPDEPTAIEKDVLKAKEVMKDEGTGEAVKVEDVEEFGEDDNNDGF
ncbi:MAG: AAA family ATPase [Methylococcaceae bacterium]